MSKRIELLDVLRCTAVIMVMLFHFYCSFLAQYTDEVKPPTLLEYGYLGVELFFIISGFVITITLEKCNNFKEFIIKRFVRLIPAMFICSIITYVFVASFDTFNMYEDSNKIYNLLISNSFISPKLLNVIFHTNFKYIDNAYWSLWVEVTFYVIAGILFFISPKNLLRNYSIIAISLIIIFFVTISGVGKHYVEPLIGKTLFASLKKLCGIFTFFEYALWFLLGMILKNLFYNKHDRRMLIYFSIIFLVQSILILNIYTACFALITYMFLLLFVYFPEKLSLLKNSTMQKLGLVSYSTYLLHGKISSVILKHLTFNFTSTILLYIVPILLVILFFLISINLYKVETFISKHLRNVLLKQRD